MGRYSSFRTLIRGAGLEASGLAAGPRHRAASGCARGCSTPLSLLANGCLGVSDSRPETESVWVVFSHWWHPPRPPALPHHESAAGFAPRLHALRGSAPSAARARSVPVRSPGTPNGSCCRDPGTSTKTPPADAGIPPPWRDSTILSRPTFRLLSFGRGKKRDERRKEKKRLKYVSP